jgi:pyruvate carboxylase
MRLGEEIEVEIEQGKTLIVKLVSVGEPQADGTRIVYFELNGQPREVVIKDESVKSTVVTKIKADSGNDEHIGATMPGTVIKVLVEKGEKVNKGDHLIITEAMKMETTVQAPFAGTVKGIHVSNGEGIQTGDLLIEVVKG